MAQNDEFEELRDDYASKQAARERRRLEKLWAKMEPISTEIRCRWLEPLVEGGPSDAEAVIAGVIENYTVWAEFATLGGMQKRRTRDYQKVVERWALWKWHTARSTPVSERDVYLTEPGFAPPTFVWPEPKRETLTAPKAA